MALRIHLKNKFYKMVVLGVKNLRMVMRTGPLYLSTLFVPSRGTLLIIFIKKKLSFLGGSIYYFLLMLCFGLRLHCIAYNTEDFSVHLSPLLTPSGRNFRWVHFFFKLGGLGSRTDVYFCEILSYSMGA